MGLETEVQQSRACRGRGTTPHPSLSQPHPAPGAWFQPQQLLKGLRAVTSDKAGLKAIGVGWGFKTPPIWITPWGIFLLQGEVLGRIKDGKIPPLSSHPHYLTCKLYKLCPASSLPSCLLSFPKYL